MAGGFRDKSLEEIKEDVARMNNPTTTPTTTGEEMARMSNPTQSNKVQTTNQAEEARLDTEKSKKQLEQQIHQDKLDRAKPNSELTEKDILLKILEKLESLEKMEEHKMKSRIKEEVQRDYG